MKKIVSLAMLITVLMCGVVLGTQGYLTYDKAKSEEITFKVLSVNKSGDLYTINESFLINKETLESFIKISWWEGCNLENGDIKISFEVDQDKYWIVVLNKYDPEIKEIRRICQQYGLLCTLPE